MAVTNQCNRRIRIINGSAAIIIVMLKMTTAMVAMAVMWQYGSLACGANHNLAGILAD